MLDTDAIRARLAAWQEADAEYIGGLVEQDGHLTLAGYDKREKAALVLKEHAPADIAALLAENESLRDSVASVKGRVLKTYDDESHALWNPSVRARLEAALEPTLGAEQPQEQRTVVDRVAVAEELACVFFAPYGGRTKGVWGTEEQHCDWLRVADAAIAALLEEIERWRREAKIAEEQYLAQTECVEHEKAANAALRARLVVTPERVERAAMAIAALHESPCWDNCYTESWPEADVAALAALLAAGMLGQTK